MEGIIFLISQPRSGSTLLQRMISTHPQIHTSSEPWLLLPAVYTLLRNDFNAEYNEKVAFRGIESFINDLPEGKEDFLDGINRMYSSLYEKSMSNKKGAVFFLDKTPRYYLIIPELQRIFPKAKFIILHRHPLAVLSSILSSWIEPYWLNLSGYKLDILEAPKLLLEAGKKIKNDTVVTSYEKIVKSPEYELKRICSLVGIKYHSEMVNYNNSNADEWVYGDKKNVNKHSYPKSFSLDKWKDIQDSQTLRLLYDYTKYLGPKTFKELGYDFDESIKVLESCKVQKQSYNLTLSLSSLLKTHKKNLRLRFKYHLVQMNYNFEKNGVEGLCRYIIKKIRY